jgi:sulfonate transport system permease protein
VFDAAVGLWNRGLLQRDLITTIGRVALGFAIGSSAALVLGTLTGLSRRVSEAVEPTLQALRTVPTLAWAPLLLLWLGIDEAPKVTLVAIGAFFPVYVNLVAGIQNVDRKLIEVARVYDLTPRAIARRVVIPASLPSLMTGLRLGLSQSWLFVVVAEFFGASAGLGFRLTDSQQSSRVDLMFVALVCLAILGKVCDMVLHAVEERTLRWRDTLATQARA